MTTPRGYKQTEVGVIPEDWEVCSLRHIALTIASGRSSARKEAGGYPVYGSTEIIGYTDTPEYEGEAILVARVGANAGTLNFVSGRYGVTDNTIILRLIDGYDLQFIFHQLETRQITKMIFGSGQPLITGTQLKNILLAIPRASEQSAIAEVLSDTDNLLDSLQRLIDKKQGIKQASMQQLLSGQTRLPGFDGEWQIRRLGDLAKIQKGELITEKMRIAGDIPVIAGGKQPSYFHATANRYEKTITVSASGANAGYISFHQKPIFASDCSTIGESEFYHVDFIFYVLLWQQDKIYALQSGGAQPHVQPKELKDLLLNIPDDLPEQTAIAQVLSDMDEEIAALYKRLDKTRQLKQALMQELLSGRTRLVTPA